MPSSCCRTRAYARRTEVRRKRSCPALARIVPDEAWAVTCTPGAGYLFFVLGRRRQVPDLGAGTFSRRTLIDCDLRRGGATTLDRRRLVGVAADQTRQPTATQLMAPPRQSWWQRLAPPAAAPLASSENGLTYRGAAGRHDGPRDLRHLDIPRKARVSRSPAERQLNRHSGRPGRRRAAAMEGLPGRDRVAGSSGLPPGTFIGLVDWLADEHRWSSTGHRRATTEDRVDRRPLTSGRIRCRGQGADQGCCRGLLVFQAAHQRQGLLTRQLQAAQVGGRGQRATRLQDVLDLTRAPRQAGVTAHWYAEKIGLAAAPPKPVSTPMTRPTRASFVC